MFSIIYYTNNLLSQELLSHTLKETIKHCRNNDCELIITSHFPLSEKYEKVDLGGEIFKDDPIYDHLVTQPVITEEDIKDIKCKIFVVGKLPYSYISIFKQILLSMERCGGENCIFMEHDCLYPSSYIPSVKKALIDYGNDFCYCNFATCFLNRNGYFNMSNGSYCLSGVSGKKKLLMEVIKNKMALMKKNMPFKYEPILDIQNSKIENEIIIKNHLCIDKFMEEGCILDIKHNLNTDGFFYVNDYFHEHKYWGMDEKYINMMPKVEEKYQKMWNYGIGKFDY